MVNTRKMLFCTVSFMVLSVICSCCLNASTKIDGLATVSSVAGDVQVQKSGSNAWTAVKDGSLLRAGDRIKVGAKSSCVLKWSNGNVMKLSPFTSIRIDQLEKNLAAGTENSSLSMWNGKVYAKAKKQNNPSSTFEIRTTTALAGVRGTELAVSVSPDETTTVECYSGVVSVKGKAGGEVILNDKQATVVKKDSQPEKPAQMQKEDEKAFEEIVEISAPTLEIMQPVGDLETDTSPVVIKGRTDTDNSVTVNGLNAVTDAAGVFTASVNLTEEVNHIKIDAMNKHGKVTTITRVVKYRRGTPDTEVSLEITQPAGGEEVEDRIRT